MAFLRVHMLALFAAIAHAREMLRRASKSDDTDCRYSLITNKCTQFPQLYMQCTISANITKIGPGCHQVPGGCNVFVEAADEPSSSGHTVYEDSQEVGGVHWADLSFSPNNVGLDADFNAPVEITLNGFTNSVTGTPRTQGCAPQHTGLYPCWDTAESAGDCQNIEDCMAPDWSGHAGTAVVTFCP
jgi:hypothetical protein